MPLPEIEIRSSGHPARNQLPNWATPCAIYNSIIMRSNTVRPHGLRRGFAAALLLRLWVQIPLEIWMSIPCECWVLYSRGLWNELLTCPEETYRLWCVVVCDLKTSWMGKTWPSLGRSAAGKTNTIWPKCMFTSHYDVSCYRLLLEVTNASEQRAASLLG
jgi:hypothetical protein